MSKNRRPCRSALNNAAFRGETASSGLSNRSAQSRGSTFVPDADAKEGDARSGPAIIHPRCGGLVQIGLMAAKEGTVKRWDPLDGTHGVTHSLTAKPPVKMIKSPAALP